MKDVHQEPDVALLVRRKTVWDSCSCWCPPQTPSLLETEAMFSGLPSRQQRRNDDEVQAPTTLVKGLVPGDASMAQIFEEHLRRCLLETMQMLERKVDVLVAQACYDTQKDNIVLREYLALKSGRCCKDVSWRSCNLTRTY